MTPNDSNCRRNTRVLKSSTLSSALCQLCGACSLFWPRMSAVGSWLLAVACRLSTVGCWLLLVGWWLMVVLLLTDVVGCCCHSLVRRKIHQKCAKRPKWEQMAEKATHTGTHTFTHTHKEQHRTQNQITRKKWKLTPSLKPTEESQKLCMLLHGSTALGATARRDNYPVWLPVCLPQHVWLSVCGIRAGSCSCFSSHFNYFRDTAPPWASVCYICALQ